MRHVPVNGGGPAGSSAAISARNAGALVTVYERGAFPRHKVCGEFLSPEIVPLLTKLGMWERFLAQKPARCTHLYLNFGKREVKDRLGEPAYGLSRYAFDKLLLDHARELGAEIVRTPAPPQEKAQPAVIAHGRHDELPRGARLFGFKAHFEGPADDAISMYFAGSAYVGVNTVEDGVTNVCGVARESDLRLAGFDFDSFTHGIPALRERLAPMRRKFDWLATGPLVFRQRFESSQDGHYRAGDALSFIDPFTGTGMVSAVLTGILAGEHAAAALPVAGYLKACKRSLRDPFLMSSLFRGALSRGWAEKLAPMLPGSWLMQWTRPHL